MAILSGLTFGGLIIWAVEMSSHRVSIPSGDEGFVSGPWDIGPSLHEMGRPAVWKAESMALGDTGFVAHVGPATYQDKKDRMPDYYSIDVEKERDSAWYVYFRRDLRTDELPEGFTKKPIEEIVSFDAISRKVSFTIGDRQCDYKLPE